MLARAAAERKMLVRKTMVAVWRIGRGGLDVLIEKIYEWRESFWILLMVLMTRMR